MATAPIVGHLLYRKLIAPAVEFSPLCCELSPLWEITFIVTERKYGGAGGEESESDERFMGLAKEGVIATTNRSQEWDG